MSYVYYIEVYIIKVILYFQVLISIILKIILDQNFLKTKYFKVL